MPRGIAATILKKCATGESSRIKGAELFMGRKLLVEVNSLEGAVQGGAGDCEGTWIGRAGVYRAASCTLLFCIAVFIN